MPGIRIYPPRSRWPGRLLVAAVCVGAVLGSWWWLPATGPTQVPMVVSSTAVVHLPAAAGTVTAPPLVAAGASLAPAAAGKPAGRPWLDFDTVDDMYKLAVRAADAADPMTVSNGMGAALACARHARAPLEALVLAGGDDAESQERVRAARLVLRRCAGFFDNDQAANLGLQKRLGVKLLAAPGYHGYGRRLPLADVTDQAFSEAMSRGDWYTLGVLIQASLPEMPPPIGTWSAEVAAQSHEAGLLFVASRLLLCDLGQNCGPDGFDYVSDCLSFKACLGSATAQLDSLIAADDQGRVQALRREMGAAVRARDVAYFRRQR